MHILQRAFSCAFILSLAASGQTPAQITSKSTPSRILSAIDNNHVVELPGNTSPLARTEFDHGAVDADLPMTHMLLLLQRSAEQETELEGLLASQNEPASANYHQWLTPMEFGKRFGPSDADVAQVIGWLQSEGMTIDEVSNGRVTVEFSGTASQVQTAFHVAIHRYIVDGATHYANASDPAIPEALAPVVGGIASLHNFFPKSMAVEGERVKRDASTGKFVTVDGTGKSSAEFTRTNSSGNTKEDVTPTDFATIYNVLPLWNAGINGAGQTIAIAGESDINLSDIATFQSSFGLSNNTPNVIHNGTAPGYTSSQEEQELDVEWSGAVAPGATITLVVTANTNTTNGFLLSAQYVIDNQLATILSESYGLCEQSIGTTGNATYNALWQQGSAEGISIFGAAGDQGSAGCENSGTHTLNPATTGLAVNGVASSPYITAVGGTDFLWQQSAPGTYWSTTNGTNGATALGYIPEIPWNATCVNPYVVALYGATSAEANCNTLAANSGTSNLVFTTGGSGGVSACTTYSSGACSGGYAKPSWQSGTGVPADGKRDMPDVSLFAGSGIPDGAASTSYLICYSGNYPCTYSNNTDVIYQEVGGTSVSAPAMAGVMALVQQKVGSPQGLANPILYQLASAESSLATCNSSTVSRGNSCVFYDTTKGSNAMPCKSGSTNCTVTTSGDSIGILSGYNATTGYDQATGLGSVNVANLVAAWAAMPSAPITFTIPNKTYGVAPFTVTASSASTGAFTYSIVSGPATISGSTVTLTGTGTVVVMASQAATANYAAATKNATFTVSAGSPTISFSISNQVYGVTPFNVSASSNSTGAFTYSIVSGPATISGSTVTVTGAGTVVVMASQAATTNYSSGTANATFTVAQQTPTISFAIPNQSYGAAPFTVSASSNSTGAFSYSIVSGPATISGSTVTVTGSGTVVVQAQQAASANYSAGSATTNFNVAQANAPTIQFAIANQTYGVAPFTVSASSNSTGTFTYSIVSGPATISGSTITLTGTGAVVVMASQAATSNYTAGSATASFTVSQAVAPTISFAIANQSAGATPFTVSASSNSTGAFTYSIVSGPATISGSTITLTGSGTVAVMASQAATSGYTAASATTNFTVSPLAASITWSPSSTTLFAGNVLGTGILDATSSVSGTMTYTATLGSGAASAITSTSTLLMPGSYTLTATLTPSSSNYSTVSTSITMTVTGPYLWVVNPTGSVTEFHGNTAVNSATTDGGGLGAAVDASNDLWTLNVGGGSVAEFNPNGVLLQSGLTGGGLNTATAMAVDGSGAVWVTNGNNSVSVFANNGSVLSPATGYTGGNLSSPSGVAIDSSGNVWITNAGNSSVTEILGGATPVSPTTNAVQNKTLGVRP
jgi:subtilase family serine protease